jgi:hypothetical protein
MMALFDNKIAADLKMGDGIMFIMVVSSSCFPPSGRMFSGSIGLRRDVSWGVFDHRQYHKRQLWVLF